MRICVAQTKPIKGDMQRNIANHKEFIELAVASDADIIIFPELSLTGYEPRLARGLATHHDDSRFDDFQKISNAKQITIGVGVPTKSRAGVCISLVLFQPHRSRQTYSKKYLHPDEELFFVSGQSSPDLKLDKPNIALAICYEISVAEHAEKAHKDGAKIYMASVAKTASGVNKAIERLSEIASTYSMTIFMSNCLGECEGEECAGKSSVWNPRGHLVGQLNDANEGILLFDTDTQELIVKNKLNESGE